MADLYETVYSKNFRDICRRYFVNAAVDISTEAPETYPNHDNRMVFAGKVLWNELPTLTMAFAIISNETIAQKIEADQAYESDMAYVVSTLVDPMSESLAALG